MMTKRRSNLIAIAKNMPKLHHSVPGEEFNIQHSEAIKWIYPFVKLHKKALQKFDEKYKVASFG